jgi:signal transduction histidine kinase
MPIALVVNVLNAALVALTVEPAVGRSVAAVWFGVVGVVTIGRGSLWWRYRRAATAANARGWSRAATVGSLCAGLCWGVGGAMLFPLVGPAAQLFLTIAIGGMCIGAVVLSASHLPTLLAFLLPACLPMASRVIAEGTPINGALGAMIVIFAAAITIAAKHLSQTFNEAMRFRFELDEANRQLHAEIAEHRATEAALRQAQKLEAIGQLTGGVAHDFNNLLTIVIGNLVMAKQQIGQNRAALQFIDTAAQAAERGVALIQRLLGFARKQRLDPRPVDLGRLLSHMREMLLTTLGSEIELIVDVRPGVAPAEVDSSQLELAILNLAINARDAMPAGGTLRVVVANRSTDASAPRELGGGDYVVLEIADTGIGMDEATLVRAFDPFFSTKDLGAGSGLGLPMVQGFVAQSGGAVRLASKFGVGTTVELWLPKADKPLADTAPTVRARSGAPAGAARIVICDDDPGVRRFVADYLGATGYAVYEASDAVEALRLIDQTAADLLITEAAMPSISGIELVQRARLRRLGLRALLIAGHTGAVDAGGESAILRKPFGAAQLGRKVGEIFGRKDIDIP